LLPEGNAHQATIAFCEGWVSSAKCRTDGTEVGGSSLVLAGYDHRIQWSCNILKPVPVGLELLLLLLIVGGSLLFFQVLKTNSFASRVVYKQPIQLWVVVVVLKIAPPS
jgi:hypothetical protein